MAEVPDWLLDLKLGRVVPFTRSRDFEIEVDRVFRLIEDQINKDREIYSQDWASVGLPGLANGCLRKASRLFDLFVLDMPGKDKPEDELRDNMMLGIYAYLYFKMLIDEYPEEEGEKAGVDWGLSGGEEGEGTQEENEPESEEEGSGGIVSGNQNGPSGEGFLDREQEAIDERLADSPPVRPRLKLGN